MAYRLKRSETIPEGVKRIVIDEIDSAAETLQDCEGEKRDKAIHETRKSLKKIRGALRLVRPELGEIYREEDEWFRDLGRQLSEIRDAQAIGEVFEALVQSHAESSDRHVFDAIRRGIEAAKREKEESIDAGRLIPSTLSFLQDARDRVPTWPLRQDGFAAIADGLKLTYRRGRRALTKVQRHPNPLTYHDFRKRVKDHWYHIRLLESLWTEALEAREASLHDLETWLGDDHNLVVLGEQLEKEPEKYGGPQNIPVFRTVADQHQKELRNNSVALGQRLYEEKPREFILRMEKLWDVWQRDPKSMKQVQKDQRKSPDKQPASAGVKASNSAPAA